MNPSQSIFIDKNSNDGILMIHGFTSTPEQFDELSEYFANRGFSVSAPLMAGHGTCPDDLIKTSPKEWKESVKKAYLELKEKSDNIFIIGNSFGSNLGLWLVKEFNNEQAGIITLGAPIYLKNHYFSIFRLYTYGLFRKYYRKPLRVYRTDYTDMSDEITYSVIPVKSMREFVSFVKKETVPNLEKIKIPAFVAHSATDPVVHPKSAMYIYEHIGSAFKKIFWFESDSHVITAGARKEELFEKVHNFIKEINLFK